MFFFFEKNDLGKKCWTKIELTRLMFCFRLNLAYLSQVLGTDLYSSFQNVSCSLPLVSLCGVLFKEYLFGKVDSFTSHPTPPQTFPGGLNAGSTPGKFGAQSQVRLQREKDDLQHRMEVGLWRVEWSRCWCRDDSRVSGYKRSKDMLFLHDVGVFDVHPCEGRIKLVWKIYSTST